MRRSVADHCHRLKDVRFLHFERGAQGTEPYARRSRQSKDLPRHAQPLATESTGLRGVLRDANSSSRNPHEGTDAPIGHGQRLELSCLIPEPCAQPVQLVDDFTDIGRGGRMYLDPDCALGASPWPIPETVVPSRLVRVICHAGKRRIQSDASCQSARVRTFDPGTVGVRQCAYPTSPGVIHRSGRGPYRGLEAHEASAARFRTATPATMSPTLPENSVNPPQPASARLSAPGSSSEMSCTEPSRVK